MISKSDLIILVVSATALGAGLYRWQRDLAAPLVATAPPLPVERAVGEGTDVAGDVTRGTDAEAEPDGAIVVRRVPDAAPASAADPVIGAVARENTATAARPASAPAPADAATALPASTRSNGDTALYGRYVIREGDYLGKLANRFGTSVATLQSINDLDGTTIHVGEELRYPLPAN